MRPFIKKRIVTLTLITLAALPANISLAGAPPAWSPQAAAKYLDERGEWWIGWSSSARGQGTSCLSCHTAVPYALARPVLGKHMGEAEPGAVEKKLIDTVKKRVANWDKIVTAQSDDKDPFVPFYPASKKPSALGTEAVLNALVLTHHDARWHKGTLAEPTRQALFTLWTQQKPNGAFLWLDFGLRPWEKEGDYYGAALAAVAVGTADEGYYDLATVKGSVKTLKDYLKTEFARATLHDRVAALWATSVLPGILAEDEKNQLRDDLYALQEPDGGWSLPRLGRKTSSADIWKAYNALPQGTAADGYATGLVVLALKRSGVAADQANVKKALAWLNANQKDGTWPVNFINKDRDPQNVVGKFMRDAGTSYASLALLDQK